MWYRGAILLAIYSTLKCSDAHNLARTRNIKKGNKMFVVVFLVDAKKHIAVPRRFIRGLKIQNLYNYGRNKRQHICFWSKVLHENPNGENCVPKFDLPLSTIYPPDQNEVCYNVQTKYFYSKLIISSLYID